MTSQSSFDSQDQEQQLQHALIPQEGIADLIVKAASAVNKTVIDNCGLCTIYCDKQVQYESVLEPYTKVGNSVGNLFNKLDTGMDVQLYRDFLFDEESVVETALSRE